MLSSFVHRILYDSRWKTRNAHVVLYPAFVGMGFNMAILYVPFFLLYFALIGKELLRPVIRREYVILGGLLLLSILPIYVFGYERITRDPVSLIILFSFSLVVGGFALQREPRRRRYLLICLYVLGIGARSLAIFSASYLLNPDLYGYGNLYNPFAGVAINSPIPANNLALLASLLLYVIFTTTSPAKNTVLLALVGLTAFFGLFVSSRAFFVILTGALLFNLVFVAKWRTLIQVVLLMGVLVLSLSVFYGLSNASAEWITQPFEQTMDRLARGLGSPRFGWYRQGFTDLLTHPLGGFEVEGSQKWFHNVFLDYGRLGGWFAVIPLLLALGYIAAVGVTRWHEYSLFGLYLFLISLALMQQDVVLEGNWQLLTVVYFSGLLLTTCSSPISVVSVVSRNGHAK